MPISPLAAAAAALGGNIMLSTGMTLQKMNVGWLSRTTRRALRDPVIRPKVFGWLAGLVLVGLSPAFNYLALLGLPPNVVAAAAGSNVAFTAILAALLLREELGKRRLVWIVVLFGAIVFAGFRGSAAQHGRAFQPLAIYLAVALPSAAAIVSVFLRRRRRGLGLAILFAAVAGSFAGSMVLPMRAVQVVSGADFWDWFSTPFPYIYLLGGTGGFIFEQLSYKDGQMSRCAPIFSGMQALWPALASYFAFGESFDAVQAGAFLVVAFAIAMIAGQRH